MKAIIFDMDGVIVDSEPLHFKLEKDILKELGVNVDRKKHESFVGVTDYNMWTSFKKMFSIELSVDEIIEIKRNRFIENVHKLELIPTFMDFMDSVYGKGYKIALASSNNKKAVEEIVKTFDLERYFDFIINGEEVEKGKPDPEIFLTVANRLNLLPEECLVIEDSRNGVIAAKSANMKCIGLKSGGSGDQDLSQGDLVIQDFRGLSIDILKGLFE